MSDNHKSDILLELKNSFLEDKRVIKDHLVDIETEIRESKDFIDSLNRRDDSDFNLFSPRRASKVYKDQIFEKENRIDELEEEMRLYYKRLSDVTKKIDSINQLGLDSNDSSSSNVDASESEDKTLYLKFQENDRKRIAADLHDGVLQNLTLVMHNLELAEKFMDYDLVRSKLEMESNRKIIKDTIDEIRSTIFDLRPMQFDDFGFVKSLENQIEYYKGRTSMTIEYHIDDIDNLDKVFLLSIFRICQELLTNSIKHSGGTFLTLNVLREKDKIYLNVCDDGKGISKEDIHKPNHFGLDILNERVSVLGGVISLPAVDKGTKVNIEIPIMKVE